jgi:hypothetical protein
MVGAMQFGEGVPSPRSIQPRPVCLTPLNPWVPVLEPMKSHPRELESSDSPSHHVGEGCKLTRARCLLEPSQARRALLA